MPATWLFTNATTNSEGSKKRNKNIRMFQNYCCFHILALYYCIRNYPVNWLNVKISSTWCTSPLWDKIPKIKQDRQRPKFFICDLFIKSDPIFYLWPDFFSFPTFLFVSEKLFSANFSARINLTRFYSNWPNFIFVPFFGHKKNRVTLKEKKLCHN